MSASTRPVPLRVRWVVAISFVLCWVVGLVVGGPALGPNATSEEVERVFAGSPAIVAFSLLVHGLAAGLLLALGRTLGAEPQRLPILVASGVAAALSIVQLVGEMTLVMASDSVDAALVWAVVTRVDGVKMIALAALVVAVHGGRVRGRIVLTVISALAVVALLLSSVGYIALVPSLMDAATASLPLLLVWVLAATGVGGRELPGQVAQPPGRQPNQRRRRAHPSARSGP